MSAVATAFDVTAAPHERVPCNLCGTTPTAIVATKDRYGLPTRIVQCVQCGLRFINPRMTAESYAAFYRDGYRPLVKTLYAQMGQPYSLRTIEQSQWEYARELAGEVGRFLPAGGTLLDVGGSTGIVGRAFRKQWGFDVTVLDPSPEELARATGCRTICGSAETAELPPVDVALLCRTMDHLLDPLAVLRRLRQCARLLIVDSRDADAWPAGSRYQVDHPYAFSARTLAAMVRRAGWAIQHTWTRRTGKYVGLVCSPQE